MKYLSSTFPVEDHWYPKEPLAQAKVDEYLHWQHVNTRLQCAMYFQVCKLFENHPKKSHLNYLLDPMVDSYTDSRTSK